MVSAERQLKLQHDRAIRDLEKQFQAKKRQLGREQTAAVRAQQRELEKKHKLAVQAANKKYQRAADQQKKQELAAQKKKEREAELLHAWHEAKQPATS